MNKSIDRISFKLALSIVIGLVLIFSVGIIGLSLPAFMPLIISLVLLIIILRLKKISWAALQDNILAGIRTGLAPLFLFLLIGMLIALWMGTGVIPSMLWLGFKSANSTWFLSSTLLVTALVGSMIGSAFTTIGTVGVALMGVGVTLGFHPALVAGAILSGAIFGDKSSPLSDSTNLAASIAETDLFAHIKNLMWTTLPALLGSLIIFTILGFGHHGGSTSRLATLSQLITPTWWSIIPLGFLVGMAILKIPAIPTLLLNIGLTGIVYLFNHSPQELSQILMDGFKTTSTNSNLVNLLNRGGMMSMMPTVIVIMLALALGGILTEQRILQTVMTPLSQKINSAAGVLTGVIFTGITANFLIGEQYLATILPGQLWKPAFDRINLSRLALGRALEDSGTVMNYLVPWGVAGSFAAQTLGVSVAEFAPFVFFAILSPVFSLLSAWTGIGIKKVEVVEDTE